ncbi:hypothetical protein [Murimonas intestini]|nr:hypothetical protein [Murimonas intestini]MCR1839425.1 hypothetical protein [Murimonas intestini]MCR1864720.1 hypothetical protein [Murimonas intestini]MCR1882330.1 hypothetical protein [Murimonas intestini]
MLIEKNVGTLLKGNGTLCAGGSEPSGRGAVGFVVLSDRCGVKI